MNRAPGPTFTKATIKLNMAYLGTAAGIAKMIEIVFGSVCFGLALTGCAPTYIPWNNIGCLPMVVFFLLVTAVCFILTCILIIMCLLSFDRVGGLHWHIMELIYNSVAVLLLIIAGCVIIAKTAKILYYVVDFRFNTSAGVFAVLLAIVYCAGAICSVRGIKEEMSKVPRPRDPSLWS